MRENKKKPVARLFFINEQEVEAVKVKITPSGIASIFWSAHYRYRKTDGEKAIGILKW